MIPEKVTQLMSARFAQAYEALGDAVTVTDLDDRLVFVNSAFEKLYGYSREELLGKPLSVLVPPDDFLVSLEMARSTAGERWEGEVLRRRKNGERFLAQLSVAPLNDEHGETVARIAIIRDLTERKRTETKANRLAHEQAVLAEIGRVFNLSLDIAEVYEQFADIVGKLISFDRLSILFIDGKQETWFNEFTAMADAPEVGLRIRHAMEGTLLEEAIRTRKAVCVGSEPVEAIVAKYPGLVPVVENGMRSAIVVPLFVKGDPIGGLALASRLEDAYLPYDVHLATVVGTQIADAVANARLHEALQKEAKEREALAEIGKIISSSLNINEVYELFADEVRNIIPFDRLVVVVNDSEAGVAQPVYISGLQILGFGSKVERNRRPGFTERLEQTGGGYVVNTHSEEEFLNKLPGIDPAFYAGFNSTVIAPLYDRGQLFGGLGFRSYDPGVYDEHDLELAERIANQIAGAIASARLHEVLQRESRERQVLAEIGRIISASLDIDEVYEQFAEEVRKRLPFDRIVINLIDIEHGISTILYVAGAEVTTQRPGVRISIEGSQINEVVRTRASHLITAADRDELVNKFPGLANNFDGGLRSFLSVPLVSRGCIIGALNLRSKKPNAYSEVDLAFADKVGNQIAGAIANAQLHVAVERDGKERAVLAEIGRIISLSLDIDEVYEQFAEQVSHLIAFDRIAIGVIDPKNRMLMTSYVAGVDVPKWSSDGDIRPLIGTLSSDLQRIRDGLLYNAPEDGTGQPPLDGLKTGIEMGLHSFIDIPLISKDQVVGTLHLRSLRVNAYTEHDLEVAKRVSNQIAGTIANVQLNLAIERESRERQVLAEISRIISSSLDIDEVFERFAEAVRKVIPFDRFISILNNSDGESLTTRYVTGEDIPIIGGPTRRRQRGGFVERVEQTGKGYFMTFHTEEELLENFPGIDPGFFGGFKSLLITPLYHKARILGMLGFRARAPYTYGERELELAEGVANQVAGAIANSLLFEERRRAEETSRTSEAKFRGLLESVPDAIVIVDNEGCIRFGNAQAENTFGYAREELAGQSIRLLLPDDVQDPHEDQLEEFLRNPPLQPMGVHLAVKARRKDESFFPADIELSPVQSEDELLMIYVIRDVTERKLAETQLRGSNDQLRALSTHLVSVREEERTRIALEIHDELGQALTAMKMELAWCEKKIVGAGEILSSELAEKVNSMSDLVDTTIESVRRISTELRPPILDNLGLAAAIEWQAQEFESRTGIRCLAHVPETISLDTDRSSAIFRITQEALTNVARHAEATTVHVRLEQYDGGLLLQVEDNGKAITEAEIYDQKSLGLLGMRERAHSLDGQLDVNGVNGRGTMVTARIPIGDVSDNAPAT